MDQQPLAAVAGTVSTTLFVVGYLPMLAKALRTREVGSYSLGNLLITNVGNAVHTVYVLTLPFGPIWFLHCFYLVASAVMLACYGRYERRGRERPAPDRGASLRSRALTGG